MGTDKVYDGYGAFDYLGAADGAHGVELADRFAGFDPHPVELDDEAAERHERLVSELPVISLHDHPFYFPADVHEDLFAHLL